MADTNAENIGNNAKSITSNATAATDALAQSNSDQDGVDQTQNTARTANTKLINANKALAETNAENIGNNATSITSNATAAADAANAASTNATNITSNATAAAAATNAAVAATGAVSSQQLTITNLTTGVMSNQSGLSGSNVEIGLLKAAAAQSGTEDPSDSSSVGSIYVNTTNQSVHVVVGTAPAIWKQVTEMTYTVGDMGPGGGVVIDITTDGLHGIEAVKLDSTIVFDSTASSTGCTTELITFAKAGFGERNSMALLYDGCSTLSADAVMSAVSFTGNGYTDWALATSAEVEDALNCSTGYCSAKFGLEKAEYWSSTVREGEPNLSVEVVFGSDSAVHSKMWEYDLSLARSVISTRRF